MRFFSYKARVEPLLERVNLNQLRVLDALLTERSVTNAAVRLGVSQSAVSHTLRVLREELGDALLTRSGRGMAPTARAEAMVGPLREALGALETALEAETFDPHTAARFIRIGMRDAFAVVVLPTMLSWLQKRAPGIDLEVPAVGSGVVRALSEGTMDAAVTVGMFEAPGILTRTLYEDDFACAVRGDHPDVGDTLDLDTYTRLPHALMSPQGGGPGIVDEVLAEMGRQRRVALRLGDFLAAPFVVAESNLVLTGPKRMLRTMAQSVDLRILPPPIDLPSFALRLFWHARLHDQAWHRWLRDLVAEAGKAAATKS